MRYLIALVFPPLAVLLCLKPFQAILNVFLTMCCYFPGALHAMLVVSSRQADSRSDREIRAVHQQTRELSRAIRHQTHVIVNSQPQAPPDPNIPFAVLRALPAARPAVPRKPIVSAEAMLAAVASIGGAGLAIRDQAFLAYRNLPEWAQPITWGLAAGTPMSIVVAIVFLMRR